MGLAHESLHRPGLDRFQWQSAPASHRAKSRGAGQDRGHGEGGEAVGLSHGLRPMGPSHGLAPPPCNHVSVQLRSWGGVPIGVDSAAKNLTLWAKS